MRPLILAAAAMLLLPHVAHGEQKAPGRVVAFMVFKGQEYRDGDTGNHVCFSGVIKAHFDEVGVDTFPSKIAHLESKLDQACAAAGRPTTKQTGGFNFQTAFNDNPSAAEEYINGFKSQPRNTQVEIAF